jgi:hypothetical protein
VEGDIPHTRGAVEGETAALTRAIAEVDVRLRLLNWSGYTGETMREPLRAELRTHRDDLTERLRQIRDSGTVR